MSKKIDLRTEVWTTPTPEMWRVMEAAEASWASVGEDANVRRLEEYGAELTGKEGCKFVATTSIANLLGLMGSTSKGDAIILESESHMVWLEGFNYAYICGLFPRLVPSERGEMSLQEIENILVAKRARKTRPPTSLIAVENPHNDHGGTVVSERYLAALSDLAHPHGCRIHMDGARIHNASAASRVAIAEYARHVDTVAISINKGLGAPFGALFCGAKADIDNAHANLLHIGAWNIHRAGIFAAAGYYAATHMAERLVEDHARAKRLADGIRVLPQLEVSVPETNMVRVSTKPSGFAAETFVERLRERGVLANQRTEDMFKLTVCHAIDDDDIDTAIAAISKVAETIPIRELQTVG